MAALFVVLAGQFWQWRARLCLKVLPGLIRAYSLPIYLVPTATVIFQGRFGVGGQFLWFRVVSKAEDSHAYGMVKKV